jgi:16S rRNA (guanine966-N2)-methyltransferase
MRIIGGFHKGRVIKAPAGLPVRPTTDFAKEALFNILTNRVDFEELEVLDLFSGTGHISLEFASRGAKKVSAVDVNVKCTSFLRAMSDELKLEISVTKADVFLFLKSCHLKFDLIFADPPYDLPEISEIHHCVFEHKLLKPGATLIIEHGGRTNLSELSHFTESRKYGNVNFSFFRFSN